MLICCVDGSPSHQSGAVWDPHICAGRPFQDTPTSAPQSPILSRLSQPRIPLLILNTIVLSVPGRQTLVLASSVRQEIPVVPKTAGGAPALTALMARCLGLSASRGFRKYLRSSEESVTTFQTPGWEADLVWAAKSDGVGGLQTTEMDRSGGEMAQLRVPAWSGEGPLPGRRLPMGSSHCVLTGPKGLRIFLGSFS